MISQTAKKNILLLLIFGLFMSSLKAQDQEKIEVFYEQQGEDWVFYAKNPSIIPYYLKFQFSELQNLKPDKDLDAYTPAIYPMSKRQLLLRLSPIDQKKDRNFNFNYVYTIGEPEKTPDYEYGYLLPYKHGKQVRIAQGNNGDGTHRGINAIDFNLAEGDTIFASRDGLVYDVKEDSNKGGNNISFEKYGNYINVYHEDGTIAKYVHLQQNGAWVNIGDKIKAGQAIGLSGNTGYSSGPHLHFMLVHNDKFTAKTLEVKFINHQGELFVPTEGKSYYAYHPNKPKFEVIEEKLFTESDFEHIVKRSNLKNDIVVDTEHSGDYTLIYVNNGFNKTIKGKLILRLVNMEATKGIPFEFEIAANSRKYLLAIKPKNPTKEYSYELSAEFR